MTNATREPAIRDDASAGTDGTVGPVAVAVAPRLIPPPLDTGRRTNEVAGSAYDRAREIDAAQDAPRPHDPDHHLAFPAAHPDSQNRGIGSALLDRHHARLDRAGLPRYLEANDHRTRDLQLRHDTARRSFNQVPDRSPLWSKWRSPMA